MSLQMRLETQVSSRLAVLELHLGPHPYVTSFLLADQRHLTTILCPLSFSVQRLPLAPDPTLPVQRGRPEVPGT